jgi:hypothetical protein
MARLDVHPLLKSRRLRCCLAGAALLPVLACCGSTAAGNRSTWEFHGKRIELPREGHPEAVIVEQDIGSDHCSRVKGVRALALGWPPGTSTTGGLFPGASDVRGYVYDPRFLILTPPLEFDFDRLENVDLVDSGLVNTSRSEVLKLDANDSTSTRVFIQDKQGKIRVYYRYDEPVWCA